MSGMIDYMRLSENQSRDSRGSPLEEDGNVRGPPGRGQGPGSCVCRALALSRAGPAPQTQTQ